MSRAASTTSRFSEGTADRLEVRAGRRAVDVEIRDRVLAELARVLLAPFGGRGERELLGVPVREHDRPLRTRPLLRERAERSRQLHQRRRAARRIDAAVDPRVAVVADDDELIGRRGAGDAAGDRPDRPHLVVHLHAHADERPAPRRRDTRSAGRPSTPAARRVPAAPRGAPARRATRAARS